MYYSFLVAISSSILIYLVVSFFSKKILVNDFRVKHHPFELLILIQVCVFSLPGVILISFFHLKSWRYERIDQSLLFEIGCWYIYSLVVFIFIVFILSHMFPIKNYRRYAHREIKYSYYRKGLWGLLFFIVFIVIAKFILLPKPPALYFIIGDPVQGYLTRIDMQNNPGKYYLPYVKQFIELIVMVQGYLGFYVYLNSEKKRSLFIYMVLSTLICIWESFYGGQKAPILLYFIGLVFMYSSKNKINSRVILLSFLLPVFSLYIFTIVTELDLDEAFMSMINRVFLGQNQGFYNIIALITPSEKYHFEAMPLIGRFGLDPSRADVDILPMIYGNRVDLVNSNSYYLGQAWSMYGYWGLLLSPFIVGLTIFSTIKVLDYIIPLSPIVIPFTFYMIFDLRINQSFTYFLFGKVIILNIIFLVIVCFIFRVFNSRYTLNR